MRFVKNYTLIILVLSCFNKLRCFIQKSTFQDQNVNQPAFPVLEP